MKEFYKKNIIQDMSILPHLKVLQWKPKVDSKHYQPGIQDSLYEIHAKPPPSTEFLHFSEVVAKDFRGSYNVLELLGKTGVCICNLPLNFELDMLQFSEKVRQVSLLKDINQKPMYAIAIFEREEAAQEAVRQFNNKFLNGNLLQVKTSANATEEKTEFRTFVVLNISSDIKPDEIQKFIGAYGTITHFELPMVDIEKYKKINHALIRARKQHEQDISFLEQASQEMFNDVKSSISKMNNNIDSIQQSAEQITSSLSEAVSYTHLTLPTILLVQISVVAVSLKKKKKEKQNNTRSRHIQHREKRKT
eukprot:TRINITY_DN65243_c0_g1_i2.p1 TRINITY_DN65243_c0_g1~~TRINITY_DN65243_c0_g1_i2.p1  ORF type:complete len:306 (+),score=49.22 TRINITY_DN65243_c0_g1_i2:188-1105(+)